MRKYSGIGKYLVSSIAVAMVLYSMGSVVLFTVDPWVFNATHLTFALVLVFLKLPATKSEKSLIPNRPSIFDIVMALLSIGVLVYIMMEFDELIYRVGAIPTTMDIVVGIIMIITVLEASRRAAGLAFTFVALGAIVYTIIGRYIPGLFGHRGYSIQRTVSYIFSIEGVYGSTLRASATYAILFITLGSFLQAFDAERFFNDISMALSGHTRGGPGKVAVLASALFGTISGHAAGNVATTGTFTIPMMKKVGYKPSFAGAIEAAASAGGQILPPVMGTVVFVMIELTGITYQNIVIAATLPAILYYLAIFLMVDFEAINLKLVGLSKNELPSVKKSMKEGSFFILAILVLLYFLFIRKSSVTMAGIWTIVSIIFIGFFKVKNFKEVMKKIFFGLEQGGMGTMKLAPLTAAAGVVIGVVTLTGVGVKLGRFLVMISGGELFFVLFFAMVLSMILGMGMSTIPAYVIAASVVAPALMEIGIPVMQAHLFVLYYACLSTITPPVCISSFTAAGIANAPPMETGMKAVKLAIVGFVVPFLFVYRPALMLQGDTMIVIYTFILAIFAIYFLSRGLQLRTITVVERGFLVVGSLLMLFPVSDWIGIVLVVVAYVIFFFNKIRMKNLQTAKE